MCGIVGFLGKPHKDNLKACELMLQLDVVRGWDSTGVALIGKKHIRIAKGAVLPQQLMQSKLYQQAVELPSFCFIGHNRAATKGEVKHENAHPFKSGKITGVHNGTLYSTYSLCKAMGTKEEDYDVDSQAMIDAIDKIGIEETWKNFYGAAALSYWDNLKKKLYLITNGDRPLNFCYLEKEEGVFFASKQWMISAANTEVMGLKLEWKSMTSLEKNKLYEFDYDRKTDKVSHTVTELKERTYTVHNYNWPNYNWDKGQRESFFQNETNGGGLIIDHGTLPDDDDPNLRGAPGTNEEFAARLARIAEDAYIRGGGTVDTGGLTLYFPDRPGERGRPACSLQDVDEKGKLIQAWQPFRKKNITEEEMLHTHPHCNTCGNSMEGDYTNSAILDDWCCVCSVCVDDCVSSGIMPGALRN